MIIIYAQFINFVIFCKTKFSLPDLFYSVTCTQKLGKLNWTMLSAFFLGIFPEYFLMDDDLTTTDKCLSPNLLALFDLKRTLNFFWCKFTFCSQYYFPIGPCHLLKWPLVRKCELRHCNEISKVSICAQWMCNSPWIVKCIELVHSGCALYPSLTLSTLFMYRCVAVIVMDFQIL